ncbi:MAG: autotransporter assembly complex protein TamA [Povalibacter sp.]
MRIEGVDDALQAAVRGNLDVQHYSDREVSRTEAQRLFAGVEEQAVQALRPYGYYHAQAQAKLDEGDKSGDYRITIRVDAGEAVTVSEAQIDVGSEAAQLPTIREAIEAFHPQKGERMQDGVYEGSKDTIATALQLNGYFDAKLVEHRVEVTSSANTATIRLRWDPGQRYKFGEVNFPDTQFSKDFLRRYVPWKPDEYYSATRMLELQQRFVDADYFSAVSVQPDLEHAENGVVAIDTLLIPAKRTIYRANAYISTDTGPGVRLGMERRWLNDRGHKIGGEMEYSQRLQSLSTYYRIPRPGERNRNYNFAAGYRDEETDTSTSRTARISANETLDLWHGYTRTLGLQYLNGDFTIADEQNQSSLLFAEASLSRKRADNLVFPEAGISVFYVARFAAEGLLSDTNLAQISAEAKWIQPAGTGSRLIMRSSLGAMAVNDFDALPPELRFFAGGDRSIRGFDYEQLGELNEAGKVIGGKYLTVASVEYEHYFLERWGAAVFVDAGDAYSNQFSLNVGAGIGLRWRSPVGILRVDVGVPVRSKVDDDGVRLHVMIGPDL